MSLSAGSGGPRSDGWGGDGYDVSDDNDNANAGSL